MKARGKVAVFGAGPGGLSVALELAERGFEVDLYERNENEVGGKARSYSLPGTGTEGRAGLPTEIGPHLLFGFYESMPDTLRRIPASDGRTVLDHFVNLSRGVIGWRGFGLTASSDWTFDPLSALSALTSRRKLAGSAPELLRVLSNPKNVALARKLASMVVSGPKRQWHELENIAVDDYFEKSRLSRDGEILLNFFTSAGCGNSARFNTRAIRQMVIGFLRTVIADTDLPLGLMADGPMSEVCWGPWADHLRDLGVRIHLGQKVTRLECQGRQIVGATITDAGGAATTVEADYYVLSTPPERTAELMNAQIVAADPQLGRIREIQPNWLCGFSVYLRQPAPQFPDAFLAVDQPWAIAGIRQSQFWDRAFSEQYGDGEVVDYISFDIPDWHIPGPLSGKCAAELTPEEVVREGLWQIRASLPNGAEILPDSAIHSWYVAENVVWRDGKSAVNNEPLFVNTAGLWDAQPEATTGIANLFLAAAYVRTDAGLGVECMESAIEAGRQAANGVLAAAGIRGERVHIPSYVEPAWLKPFTMADDMLFDVGRKLPVGKALVALKHALAAKVKPISARTRDEVDVTPAPSLREAV